jgi:hypothetical protein
VLSTPYQQRYTRVPGPFQGAWIGFLNTSVRIYDLSEGGCFVHTLQRFPASGRPLVLKIDVPDEGWICLKAQVVYSKPKFGFAVSFVDVPADAADRLRRGLLRLRGMLSESEKDEVIVEREGDWNVMSVSLLRLKSGAIGLFYLRKNSLTDCRPLLRLSTDEAKTWSQPIECITDNVGYYVLNNDRAEQLSSGRLILPVCHHANEGGKFDVSGTILCYLSDDDGQTLAAQQNRAPGHRWRQTPHRPRAAGHRAQG